MRLAVLALGVLLTLPASAETVLVNSNGTKTTVYHSRDKTRRVEEKRYDAFKRTPSDAAQDPMNRREDLKEMFPEEYAKELETKLAKARMTEEQKAKERKLLDRTGSPQKVAQPNVTDNESIPKRF